MIKSRSRRRRPARKRKREKKSNTPSGVIILFVISLSLIALAASLYFYEKNEKERMAIKVIQAENIYTKVLLAVEYKTYKDRQWHARPWVIVGIFACLGLVIATVWKANSKDRR